MEIGEENDDDDGGGGEKVEKYHGLGQKRNQGM